MGGENIGKESFLSRSLRNTGFAIGAGALAAMLLSAATSQAGPRERYAQHQSRKGKTLNTGEARAYKTVKQELEMKGLSEDIAPYAMAILRRRTRFRPRKIQPKRVKRRLERIVENLERFDGLICPDVEGPYSRNDDLEAGIGAYLNPGYARKVQDPCKAYERLRSTGRSIRKLAEEYRQKIKTYEARNLPGTPEREQMIASAITEAERPKHADKKPAEERPADKRPAEERPADKRPAEERPAEERPAEREPKPADPEPIKESRKEMIAPEKIDAVAAETTRPKDDRIIDAPVVPDDLEKKIEAEKPAAKNKDTGGEKNEKTAPAADKEKKKPERKYQRLPKCRSTHYRTIDGRLHYRIRIKPNDNLWELAREYTGSALNHKRIRRYGDRPIDDANPIRPGQNVYIPARLIKRQYRNNACFRRHFMLKRRRRQHRAQKQLK